MSRSVFENLVAKCAESGWYKFKDEFATYVFYWNKTAMLLLTRDGEYAEEVNTSGLVFVDSLVEATEVKKERECKEALLRKARMEIASLENDETISRSAINGLKREKNDLKNTLENIKSRNNYVLIAASIAYAVGGLMVGYLLRGIL